MNPSLTISKLTSSIVEFCKDALKAMCISRYHNSVHQIFEGCVQYFSSIHLYFPLNVGWIMFGKIRLADISFRGLGTIFVVQPRNFLLISSEYCKERMKQLQWPSQGYFEDFMKIFLITTCQLSNNNQSFTRSYQKVQKCNKTTSCL